MVNLDIAELRPKIDLENLFVDFSSVRTALSVATILKDLKISLSDPTDEGECRGKCPKCGKDRSFSLNINTNRFNCFAKGCPLKGGGVIDFFAKLKEIPAKEASHLLACAYGIQPYSQVPVSQPETSENPVSEKPPAAIQPKQPKQGREVECREKERWNKDFDKLSEDEITELLSHSILCDYHNCLVTEYERSVLPALDKYYEEKAKEPEQPKQGREVVSREEFDKLESKVKRLSDLVWSLMFEQGEIDEQDLFDGQKDYEFGTARSI